MHRHSLVWIAIFSVLGLLFVRLPLMVAKQDGVVHTYGALLEVDALARQNFVAPLESRRLVHGAIRGLLRTLDPYSGYISPEELPAFERRSAGDYIGIGIEVGMRDGRLTVIAPTDGGPADEAGILAGDKILAINNHDTEAQSVFDVEELIRRASTDTVRLRVLQAHRAEPEEFLVRRGAVSLQTVRGFRRDESGAWDYAIDRSNGIAYIRVSNFLENTIRDFDAALGALERAGVRGLILDLRFNPGGLMQQAIDVVDRFVDSGIILSTVTRRWAVQEYSATPEQHLRDAHLVVLVNHGSASASEIVAGSLQAHGRALLIGERSFGKGSVQRLIPLTETGGAVKLTTAYYRLPNNRIVHRTQENEHTDEWGVLPDVVIRLTDAEKQQIRFARRRLDCAHSTGDDSRDTRRRSDGTRSSTSSAARTDAVAASADPIEIVHDRQLDEALRQLRRLIRDHPARPATQ